MNQLSSLSRHMNNPSNVVFLDELLSSARLSICFTTERIELVNTSEKNINHLTLLNNYSCKSFTINHLYETNINFWLMPKSTSLNSIYGLNQYSIDVLSYCRINLLTTMKTNLYIATNQYAFLQEKCLKTYGFENQLFTKYSIAATLDHLQQNTTNYNYNSCNVKAEGKIIYITIAEVCRLPMVLPVDFQV